MAIGREELLRRLGLAAPSLRERFGVRSLAVFGSVARGEASPTSDVDLLVTFDPGRTVTLVTMGRLQEEIERIVGRCVDLVEDHAALRPAFRATIEREMLRVA